MTVDTEGVGAEVPLSRLALTVNQVMTLLSAAYRSGSGAIFPGWRGIGDKT
jgi:hypothetical protein